MTNNNQFSIRFADEFENNLYKLSKKYRNIKADIKSIIEQLLKGNILGDRISGFSSDIYVYKIRVKNSNIQKGKFDFSLKKSDRTLTPSQKAITLTQNQESQILLKIVNYDEHKEYKLCLLE